MKPKELFEVGVRLLGIWQLLIGLYEVVTALNVFFNQYRPGATTANAFMAHALMYFITGGVLLFSVPRIVNAMYPSSQTGADDADGSNQMTDA